MNNKTKTAETKMGKPSLVPKLRFPEFRSDSGWLRKPLSDCLFESKARNRSLFYTANDVISVSGEFGCVNQIEHMGRSYAGASVKEYHVVETGDIVYTKSPLKKNPYGIIKENKGRPGIVSTLYAVYHPKDGCISAFIDNYFSRDDVLNAYLQPIVRKGAKNDMKVNNDAVLSGHICIPKPAEQLRISEFLSNLDGLIRIQTQKVEALKAHKKGIMQLLFPAEGEILPKLRFPEFRNAPEWQPIILKDACNMQSGKFIAAAEIYEQQLADLYRCFGGNGLRGYTKTYNTSGKFPLVGRQGALCGNVNLVEGDYYATEHALVARPRNGVDVVWLYYLLDLLDLNRFATGQAQPGLSVEVLEKVPALKPKDELEQQRIANCLSSLDRLITAEVQKVDALRAHKKGLMQQLFPAISEAQE